MRIEKETTSGTSDERWEVGGASKWGWKTCNLSQIAVKSSGEEHSEFDEWLQPPIFLEQQQVFVQKCGAFITGSPCTEFSGTSLSDGGSFPSDFCEISRKRLPTILEG
ncbi:hypothetical protein CEXT_143951 [Caerostris extrusa]|uniref:Uncharacterized protein n=1 Tax=Caerostris extrusa TaxID=172846 RepID=A0AAV4PU81_CAEEX|nr:hypothetical protein CEXT_143951 [Caerostris extrusa]